jgi:hypothetical protein
LTYEELSGEALATALNSKKALFISRIPPGSA